LCLARWNAHLSAATSDLHKAPIVENEDAYFQYTDTLSDENEINLDKHHEDSTSSEITDEELELAPVSGPEDNTNLETQNHLGRLLGLNDPDLYDNDTDSGYEPDADDGIWQQGAMEMPYSNPMDETVNESDHCPEVDESAESVVIDLFPGAAEVIHIDSPPFSSFTQKQHKLGHGNIYYPFAGPVEWDLARWLHGAGSMVAIDQFLKLKYVSTSKHLNISIFDRCT
jgi:hypothetical protein